MLPESDYKTNGFILAMGFICSFIQKPVTCKSHTELSGRHNHGSGLNPMRV
jgi:hypothetical protein